ncbi:MAG: hypothetical protein JOZ57_14545, partial [Abitibacteriaceae bacterium]|nr:hypothetical protein [Abditibacteriaceae bacterium]
MKLQVQRDVEPEPRWPAVIALLCVGSLYEVLPLRLSIAPRGVLFGVICILLVPTIITHQTGHHDWNKFFGYLVIFIETVAMIASVILLVAALPTHKETPITLLRAAGSLWLTNVLVFALWYWRLDAGGPH